MNRKIIKKINRQVPIILVDWIKSLVDPEEHTKISVKNLDKYLPELQYLSIKGTYVLGQFSKRWTYKILKKMVVDGHTVENIGYNYFNKHYKEYAYGRTTEED